MTDRVHKDAQRQPVETQTVDYPREFVYIR